MKLRILFIIMLLPCVLAAYGLRPLVWVIDAGHGGHDHGTEGKLCKEKDVNLNITRQLVALLARHKPGIKVITTRNRDEYVSLQARCRKANRAHADLFLSIHVNSAPNRRLRGTETFYGCRGGKSRTAIQKSELLARLLQKCYHDAGRPIDRGVKTNPLYVTTNASMPAVLTEVAFMSNTHDERYLASEAGQREIARMIFNGLMEYYTTTQAKTHRKTLATLHQSRDRRSGVKPALHLDVRARDVAEKAEAPAAKAEKAPEESAPQKDAPVQTAQAGAAQEAAPAEEAVADAQAAVDSIPVFSVQLFSCSTAMQPGDKRLKGIAPVTFVQVDATYKCLYQGTTDYQQARHHLKKVKAKFPDAFIVAFLGEKPISTAEALEMVRKK